MTEATTSVSYRKNELSASGEFGMGFWHERNLIRRSFEIEAGLKPVEFNLSLENEDVYSPYSRERSYTLGLRSGHRIPLSFAEDSSLIIALPFRYEHSFEEEIDDGEVDIDENDRLGAGVYLGFEIGRWRLSEYKVKGIRLENETLYYPSLDGDSQAHLQNKVRAKGRFPLYESLSAMFEASYDYRHYWSDRDDRHSVEVAPGIEYDISEDMTVFAGIGCKFERAGKQVFSPRVALNITPTDNFEIEISFIVGDITRRGFNE